MMPQIIERWSCDRCPATGEKPGSRSDPNPAPPNGWRELRLHEVSWVLCTKCVDEFQSWLTSGQAKAFRAKGFPFDKAAPVFPGKAPLP